MTEHPFEIALARGVIAGVGIVVFLALRRRLGKPLGVEVRVGVVMAVTNMAIPFVMSNVALQYASAGFVALPTALPALRRLLDRARRGDGRDRGDDIWLLAAANGLRGRLRPCFPVCSAWRLARAPAGK